MAQIGPLRGAVQFHPHLACRLPYRFPRGKIHTCASDWCFCRGFPTDFPAVSCERRNVLGSCAPGARLRPVGDGGGMEGRVPTACGVTPASIHAAISALVKVADGLSITAQARSSIEGPLAWSGARLSTPCTHFAVNF